MIIKRSIDIEEEIRKALSPHLNIYCRPLPTNYDLPNILVSVVGGTEANTIDGFNVTLDARAKNEAQASEYLRNAVGLLKKISSTQETPISYIQENAIAGNWGSDPVRPDLAMFSATLIVTAHKETTEV